MEANQRRSRWTYAEFARLPSEEGTRHEIIDGHLVVTPSPSVPHQRIVARLLPLLREFVLEHGLGEILPGPVDVLFAEGDYLVPDLVFIRESRSGLLSDRGIEGAPDLVVEIASPSTVGRDRGVKLERYRRFGVPGYWVVDPERGTVDVWELVEGAEAPMVLERDDLLTWTPVPGGSTLRVAVADILGQG